MEVPLVENWTPPYFASFAYFFLSQSGRPCRLAFHWWSKKWLTNTKMGPNFAITITFAIATIISLLLGIHLEHTKPQCKRMVRQQFTQFESGDLLLFHSSVFLSLLLGSTWTHVALVVEENGSLYLWETRPPLPYPVLTPLHQSVKERLEANQYVAWRAISTPIACNIEHLEHYQYNFSSWRTILNLWLPQPWFLSLPREKSEGKSSCVDLVKQTLLQSNVYVPPFVCTPQHFSSESNWTFQWEVERQILL